MKLPLWVLRRLPMWDYVCPDCHRQVCEDDQECPYCGQRFPEPERVPPRILKDPIALADYVHKYIMPHVSPTERAELVKYFTRFFSNGFETNDHSLWSGTDKTDAQCTIDTQSTVVRYGTYAQIASTNDPNDSAYAYKTFTGKTTLYVRAYVRFDLAITTDTKINVITIGDIEWNNVIEVRWANWGATKYVGMSVNPEGSSDDAAYGWAADTWYCMEVKVVKGDTDGAAQLWVNEASQITKTNVDTSHGFDYGIVRVGLLWSPMVNTAYHDNVVVADAYIGPCGEYSSSVAGSMSTAGATKTREGYLRKIASTVGFSGLSERAIALTRKIVASIGTAAATKRIKDGLRRTSGVLSSVGNAARIITLTRAASGATSLIGGTKRIITLIRETVGSLSFAGMTERVVQLTRTITGIINFTAIIKRIKGTFRTALATLSVVGNVGRIVALTRTAIGTASLTGLSERAVGLTRTVVGSVGISGIPERLTELFRTVAGSISATAITKAFVDFLRKAAPSLSLSGTVKRIGTLIRRASESISISATVVVLWALVRSASTSIGITGIGRRVRDVAKGASATISMVGTLLLTKRALKVKVIALQTKSTILGLFNKLKTIKRASGKKGDE